MKKGNGGGWYRAGQIIGIVVGVIAGSALINMVLGPRQRRDYGNNNNMQMNQQNQQQFLQQPQQPQSLEYQMLNMNQNQNTSNRAYSVQ